MGRRIAAVLVLALVGTAAERAAAKEAVKEELAAEQVRTGVHTKKDPRLDGIVHPLDESADEKEFFWFNEVTGESAWELPVVEMEQEDENGEVGFYYLDTKTKEIFEEPPERWAWTTYTEKETNVRTRAPHGSLPARAARRGAAHNTTYDADLRLTLDVFFSCHSPPLAGRACSARTTTTRR